MGGSIFGNIIGTVYFLVFQCAGFVLAGLFLRKDHPVARFVIGSTIGSLLLQWLPILYALLLDFTVEAHVAALVTLAPIIYMGLRRREILNADLATVKRESFLRHRFILILAAVTFVFWVCLLLTHTIQPAADGSFHTGQSCYGDMNMHLGFITGIAVQQTFPPMYSIFPGLRLAYPFLSDSISSSIYVMGASLRYAYILPMLAAFLQVMGMIYLLAYEILRSRSKAVLAWALFLFNGGFGFSYFLDYTKTAEYNFKSIFTGFYTTPTNLTGNNIRWVNMIADMLLPQRATLFGYAAAFTCIYLLYRAVFSNIEEKRSYFIIAGLILGSLPLIHTHSFLASGLIAASWLLYVLYREHKAIPFFTPGVFFIAFAVFLGAISFLRKKGVLQDNLLMPLAIGIFALIVLYGVVLLISHLMQKDWREFVNTWGIFLACALIFALPQLIFWTFGQVAEGGFVRGHFNWGNQGDMIFWFYLKNLGLPFLLLIGAIFSRKRKLSRLFLPAGLIWLLAELVLFTPNPYDNNKLLYIAYLLLMIAVADYAVDLYHTVKDLGGARILTGIALIVCFISGVLTLGREIKSDYQLYSAAHVHMARFIEDNTEPTATILTDTRHVNEVASLTGRNIVCGADTFLFYHGIDTSERKAELRRMFEEPSACQDLFEKYDVSYASISSYERNNYNVDASWFEEHGDLVFAEEDIELYRLRN